MLVLVGRWLNATKVGGQQPAEPFRIAGNFYYVGANDVAAFLITGPEGHVVLDGGYPSTAPMIMASIAKLGFNIKDVKVRRTPWTRSSTPRAIVRISTRPRRNSVKDESTKLTLSQTPLGKRDTRARLQIAFKFVNGFPGPT